MPSYDTIMRSYRKDDLEMLAQAQLFADNYTMDQAAFMAAFPKFTVLFGTNFQTAITTADAIPPDESVVQLAAVITEQITAKMVLAQAALQKLFYYVKVAFNSSEAIAKTFGKSDYEPARSSALRMKELLEKAHLQCEVAANKAALLAAGYTQAMIDELDTLMDDIATLNKSQNDAYSGRLKQTEDRILAYNDVWDYMEQISEGSKVVFWDSPAKLAQYVLYPTSYPVPGKVTGLTFIPAGTKFTWDFLYGAAEYELETRLGAAAPFTQIYKGIEREFVHVPLPGTFPYRCRGINEAGLGYWSDELPVTFP